MRNVVEPDEVTSSRDPVGCALGSLPHFDAIQGPLVGALAPARRRGEPPRPLWCVQGHQLPPHIGWHALARLTRASRAHGGKTGGGTAVRLAATACAVLASGLRSQMATDLTPPASRLTSGSSAGDRVPPATPQLAAQLAKLIDSVPHEKRKRVLEQAGVVEVASSRERVVEKTLYVASSLSFVHFYIGSDLISKLCDRVAKADKNTPLLSLDGACLVTIGFVVTVQACIVVYWGHLVHVVLVELGAGVSSSAYSYFNTSTR